MAHAALFAVALIYGANYTIAKLVLDDHYIGPKAFILFRVTAGLILMGLTQMIWFKQSVEKRDIPRLMLCGLFGVAINQMFFFMGLKETVPIHAALIMTMTPLIVLMLSVAVGFDRWSRYNTVGLLSALFGAIYLITDGSFQFHFSRYLKGDIMILINAISYGLYLILVKSLLRKYNAPTIMKWVFAFGLLYVLPFSFGEAQEVEWRSFNASVWLAFAYVLVFTTFIAYLLNAFALSQVSPSVLSVYIYLQPLLASIIAVALQKDSIDAVKILSALFIVFGVWMAGRGQQCLERSLKKK